MKLSSKNNVWFAIVIGLLLLGTIGVALHTSNSGSNSTPTSVPTKNLCLGATMAARAAAEDDSYSDDDVRQMNSHAKATCDAVGLTEYW